MNILKGFFTYPPLGMNFRNYLIRSLNSKTSLQLAKDKVSFKHVLEENGIPTPRTYHEIHDFSDMKLISWLPDEFVIKPGRGLGGNGIILLKRKNGLFHNPSGDRYSVADVKRHIRKILDGDYSGYIEHDAAIIEERIFPSEQLQFKNAIGLPDIRIFCHNSKPVMGMMRYPTLKSKGRSNLALGALGIGIEIEQGTITHIHSKKANSEYLPEYLGIRPSFVMPQWEETKMLALKASRLCRLGLAGVDITLDVNDKLMVLEINGRPGLEIQNINEISLLPTVNGHSEMRPSLTSEMAPAGGDDNGPGLRRL
ncbi:MAG: sugar-transfer associated ATP-grasp domain-containing protein [Candidatus Neomarinimicrobiota bacterium]